MPNSIDLYKLNYLYVFPVRIKSNLNGIEYLQFKHSTILQFNYSRLKKKFPFFDINMGNILKHFSKQGESAMNNFLKIILLGNYRRRRQWQS